MVLLTSCPKGTPSQSSLNALGVRGKMKQYALLYDASTLRAISSRRLVDATPWVPMDDQLDVRSSEFGSDQLDRHRRPAASDSDDGEAYPFEN